MRFCIDKKKFMEENANLIRKTTRIRKDTEEGNYRLLCIRGVWVEENNKGNVVVPPGLCEASLGENLLLFWRGGHYEARSALVAGMITWLLLCPGWPSSSGDTRGDCVPCGWGVRWVGEGGAEARQA